MSSIPRFNRKQPYGTVHGGSVATYEQNGVLFDSLFRPVDLGGNLLYPNEAPPPEPEPVAATRPAGPTPIDPEDAIDEEPRIDLRAWRAGEAKAAWAHVAAEIQRQFGIVVRRKEDAYEAIDKAFPPPGEGVGIKFA